MLSNKNMENYFKNPSLDLNFKIKLTKFKDKIALDRNYMFGDQETFFRSVSTVQFILSKYYDYTIMSAAEYNTVQGLLTGMTFAEIQNEYYKESEFNDEKTPNIYNLATNIFKMLTDRTGYKIYETNFRLVVIRLAFNTIPKTSNDAPTQQYFQNL
jgi:mRNA-degrading endonuclease HigB of HigAB toxin-antitoxin module